MGLPDPKVDALRAKIAAAREEFDLAVTFHEVWKPAAFDSDLHQRVTASRSGKPFVVIRTALRREMVLALMRLWDGDKAAVGMTHIGVALRDRRVIEVLAEDRATRIPLTPDNIRLDLSRQAESALALISRYERGGSGEELLKKLRVLRDKRLAHRQIKPPSLAGGDPTTDDVERFYLDMSDLIALLLSLAHGVAYDPQETAKVYRISAYRFWQGAGHANPEIGLP